MDVVKKYSKGQGPEVIRSLPENDVSQLLHSSEQQQELLKSLYGNWLLCSCGVPTTIKLMRETGRYFLVRVTDREKHQRQCPFFTLQDEQQKDTLASAKHVGTSFSFSILASNTEQKSPIAEQNAGSSQPQPDKLYTLVASLLTEAKCNVIAYSSNSRFTEATERVRNAARKYSLGGKSLQEYLCFGFGQMKELIAKLQQNERVWLGRHRPQGIILAHVQSVTHEEHQYTLHVKDGWDIKLPRSAKVARLNGRFSLKKGPLLVAAVVTKVSDGEESNYSIQRCVIMPVVNSHSYLIVDSDLERTFAKIATKVILEKGSPHQIEKPMVPIIVDDCPVLADFVIRNTNLTKIAIEVMGAWDDEHYRERKERIIGRMLDVFQEVRTVGMATAKDRSSFYEESYTLLGELL